MYTFLNIQIAYKKILTDFTHADYTSLNKKGHLRDDAFNSTNIKINDF